jgi:hypothetical protein
MVHGERGWDLLEARLDDMAGFGSAFGEPER